MSGAPPRDILRAPRDGRFILLTLIAGYMLNLLPFNGATLLLRPDFALLALLYWCVHEPKRLGQTAGFGLGLLVDICDSSVLGVHGLTYSVAAYLSGKFRLRILSFGMWQQAWHLLPVLLLTQGLTILMNVFLRGGFPGWSYFAGALVGAALWPGISLLMEYPEYYPDNNDA